MEVMSTGDLVDLAVVLAICAGCGMLLPQVWRGWLIEPMWYRGSLRTRGEVALGWWPWGDASRRGAVRGFVATTFAGWALALGIVTVEASVYLYGGVTEAARISGFVFLGLFVVWFGVFWWVVLFNRPKFIVPPAQRDELGVVAERTARRAAEKADLA